MSEEQKKPEEQQESFGRDQAQEMINAAMASVTRQFSTKIEKSLTDFAAKLSEKKPEETAPQDDKGKDTKSKVYEQQLADLKRRLDESETKAKRVEEAARQERVQSQLRSYLEAAKVRPELLDVAVGHIAKVSGALRYGDDGSPLLAVKRSRTKGAAAEELLFDDIKAGVDDWAKSEEAKAFLAPPSAGRQQPTGQRQPFTGAPVSDEDRVSRIIDLYQQSEK